jgi:hypothetical protein
MAAATASVNGYMSSTYASKLNGIAAGATNVTNTNQLTNGAGFITSSGTSAACSGNSATATKLSTASGSAPSYSARAWVNFNGATIRASGNVSSVTVNSAGFYTVNFTTAMADANYGVNYSVGVGTATATYTHLISQGVTVSTTAVQVKSWDFNGGAVSYAYNNVTIMR